MNKSELSHLLKKEYFQRFLHKNVSQFALYRGHFNATVLTLKYSILVPEFTENNMIDSILKEVFNFFPPQQKSVRALIEYDVVLKAFPLDQIEDSYYFWKANSNRNSVPNSETMLQLTHDAIFMYIRNAAQINPTDLDLYYVNSNVSVDRITSIIFTFISV
jgi:hypothetical protein